MGLAIDVMRHYISTNPTTMKTQSGKGLPQWAIENQSEKIILEKMGISYAEYLEIKNMYGVSATKVLELMQMSKYQFVYPGKVDGQC